MRSLNDGDVLLWIKSASFVKIFCIYIAGMREVFFKEVLYILLRIKSVKDVLYIYHCEKSLKRSVLLWIKVRVL